MGCRELLIRCTAAELACGEPGTQMPDFFCNPLVVVSAINHLRQMVKNVAGREQISYVKELLGARYRFRRRRAGAADATGILPLFLQGVTFSTRLSCRHTGVCKSKR